MNDLTNKHISLSLEAILKPVSVIKVELVSWPGCKYVVTPWLGYTRFSSGYIYPCTYVPMMTFENPTGGLHVLFVLNSHAKFNASHISFTI